MEKINPYHSGRDSLIRFCILTDRKYAPNWHHRVKARELERLAQDITTGYPKQIFLVIEEPPRHGKSEIASIKFPAWFLGKYPDKEIITSSYSAELALDFGSSTRGLVSSPEYQQVFPNTKLKEDEKGKGRWKTTEKGAYTSIGVGGAATGRGADIFLIDDPIKNREEAESRVYRDRIYNWWTSTAFTRLEPHGAMIFIMTRWNEDDLVGRVLDKFKDDPGVEIRRVSFPGIAEKDEYIDGKLMRSKGEALWEDKYPLEELEKKKRIIGIRDFAALYQQDPITASGNVFKREDYRYFNLSDLTKEDFTVAIHIDPAFSTSQESDDVGIAVSARNKKTKEVYLLEVFGEPLLPSESYSYVLSLAEKWHDWTIDFISVEEATISKDQQDFLNGFDKYMREKGKFYTVLLFRPRGKGKKEDRIKFSLEPMFNRHALYFRSDMKQDEYWMKLENQIMKFPTTANDDILDAVSQGVIMWESRGVSNTDDDSFREYVDSLKKKKQLLEIKKKNAKIK